MDQRSLGGAGGAGLQLGWGVFDHPWALTALAGMEDVSGQGVFSQTACDLHFATQIAALFLFFFLLFL